MKDLRREECECMPGGEGRGPLEEGGGAEGQEVVDKRQGLGEAGIGGLGQGRGGQRRLPQK